MLPAHHYETHKGCWIGRFQLPTLYAVFLPRTVLLLDPSYDGGEGIMAVQAFYLESLWGFDVGSDCYRHELYGTNPLLNFIEFHSCHACCLLSRIRFVFVLQGAALAGPAIFGIVYSSVAIWTAVLSRICFKRKVSLWQWACVFVVFVGLALTAMDVSHDRNSVHKGATLVLVGSMMHGLFYVMSEYIMTYGDDRLTARQNCAIQNFTAMCFFFVWQVVYTMPRADEKLWQPMEATGTTLPIGISFLILFGAANLIHAISFYHTLKYFPGGATSAGVMKGLQAVLVFVFTHLAFCGRRGGPEMCFTKTKFLSLVTVVSGVIGYGLATNDEKHHGYERIGSVNELSEISNVKSSALGRDEESI
ncbi:unnamed protein product [Cylindrotheca closterium]|uniref:Sugar phosphate transporter domain-containing protein n=1 Tax=Cylindrotheca closterium TaxID=2856 RepID=A0AAD2G1M0_9STRA|nr:unnamed protein product [Cylindrotheca closterium]